MPALKDSDGNTAVSMRAKEALVRKSAFPKSPTNVIQPLRLSFGSAHTKITEELVAQALMTQLQKRKPYFFQIPSATAEQITSESQH